MILWALNDGKSRSITSVEIVVDPQEESRAWKPPEEGLIKVNVDGAFLSRSG